MQLVTDISHKTFILLTLLKIMFVCLFDAGISLEFQMMYVEDTDSPSTQQVGCQLLENDSIEQLVVSVENKNRKKKDGSPLPFKSILLYSDYHGDVAGFDPMVPSLQLKDLGYCRTFFGVLR